MVLGGSRNTQMRLYHLAAQQHHRAHKQVPLGASPAASLENRSGIAAEPTFCSEPAAGNPLTPSSALL